MNVYRIKHKPSGLYYQPVKGRFTGRITNLGPNGKVYIAKKPTLESSNIKGVRVSDKQITKYGLDCDPQWHNLKFVESDWNIQTYELKDK